MAGAAHRPPSHTALAALPAIALDLETTGLAVANDRIPPTINLENADPDCDLNYTPHEVRTGPVNSALSNTFGFGGHNTAIIFRKFAE